MNNQYTKRFTEEQLETAWLAKRVWKAKALDLKKKISQVDKEIKKLLSNKRALRKELKKANRLKNRTIEEVIKDGKQRIIQYIHF